MKRKLKCTCGKCNTCKMRVYMRKRAKLKAKSALIKYGSETKKPKFRRAKIVESQQEVEERAALIIKRAKAHGPQFLEVVDNTGLGLEIRISKRMKTIMVSISCVESKPQEVIKTDIRKIHEAPIEGSVE